MTASLYLGADIGGTKIEAVLATDDGTVLAHRKVLTPARQGRDAVLAAVVTAVRELRDQAATDAPVRGVGLGTHGVVTYPEGAVALASDALPGWTGASLLKYRVV